MEAIRKTTIITKELGKLYYLGKEISIKEAIKMCKTNNLMIYSSDEEIDRYKKSLNK